MKINQVKEELLRINSILLRNQTPIFKIISFQSEVPDKGFVLEGHLCFVQSRRSESQLRRYGQIRWGHQRFRQDEYEGKNQRTRQV